MATREFCDRLSQPSQARLIDRVVVKGKSIPLELFEMRHKSSHENFDEINRMYTEAFGLYQAGKFGEAETRFRMLSTFDKPSSILADRCAEFGAGPPENWSGIFSMATK